MTKHYRGTCMCGSVQFSFVGPPKFVKDCVCESCRRAHGASAIGWVGVDKAQFRFDAGESSLNWYQSSDASQRGFCTACGTRVLFRSKLWPGEMHMALACIEVPHDLLATGVSFKEELPAWTALSLRD